MGFKIGRLRSRVCSQPANFDRSLRTYFKLELENATPAAFLNAALAFNIHAANGKWNKKLFTLLDLCVSSLRRGHANLLCIVPILTDDPRRESR